MDTDTSTEADTDIDTDKDTETDTDTVLPMIKRNGVTLSLPCIINFL
jgi:hypothetical protein